MIDQIVAGAERAFLATGYDLATMDLVARHAGVARGSVYNHFASKEALFLEVMRRGIDDFVTRAIGHDEPLSPHRERIRVVATDFLRAASAPDAIEMYRTVIAHATRFPELNGVLYTRGLERIEHKLRSLALEAGSAMIPDPTGFAEQLLASLMGGYFSRRLLGISGHPGDEDLDAYVRGAVGRLLPPPSAP